MITKSRALQWACLLVAGLFAGSLHASHGWGSYHWARTTSSFTLETVDSMTAEWNVALDGSISEWSYSTVLDLDILKSEEATKTRKRCAAVTGQLRVCNAAYGFNGWLGLASIYLDNQGHIVKGTAKMNDSYASYWTPAERNHVACQEIGHVLGLAHTSEDGSSQGTCMDYSSADASQWPNQHDYDQLLAIYGDHYDTYDSHIASSAGGCNTPTGHGCVKSGIPEASPPMGVLVHKGPRFEIWVAPGRDGGLWIHHVTTVPEGWTE